MALTYAQLVAAVTDYTQNTFDTTTINVMIKQAEQRIYNTVQIANLRKNVTGVLSTGNKYLACPEDFLSTYSLAIYPYNATTATGTAGQKTTAKAQGMNLKPPQPEGGSRRDSFCARMSGMKKKLTSAKTANDPNSRINKALRAWNC